jgi:predicted O-methyltransferase YrrM
VQLGRNWIHCHYPKRHELVIGDSRITIPEYASANPGKTFDLVFIDGGHDYAIARADLKNCQELSNPKTIVVMDDVMSNQDWLSEWNVGPTKAWFEAVEDGAAIELGNVVFSRLFGLSYGRYLF